MRCELWLNSSTWSAAASESNVEKSATVCELRARTDRTSSLVASRACFAISAMGNRLKTDEKLTDSSYQNADRMVSESVDCARSTNICSSQFARQGRWSSRARSSVRSCASCAYNAHLKEVSTLFTGGIRRCSASVKPWFDRVRAP